MRKFSFCLIALLLFLGLVPASAATDPDPIVLAVHPYLSSEEIQKRFAPLATYLGKAIDRKVIIRVGRDYNEHIDAIGKNSVDIAYMGPAPYAILVSKFGRKPLLARIAPNGKPYLNGVIITRQDSPIRSVADLRDKRFAFGDPNSTMSTLIPQYFMKQEGLQLSSLSSYDFLSSHKNVALGILVGDFDAGAVKIEVFDEFQPRGLRVLVNLPPIPEHLFITRSDMPPEQIKVLRKALLQLKNDPDGPTIMTAMHKDMTEMSSVSDEDYNHLRTILTSLGILSR